MPGSYQSSLLRFILFNFRPQRVVVFIVHDAMILTFLDLITLMF